jgi:hypothetical protein
MHAMNLISLCLMLFAGVVAGQEHAWCQIVPSGKSEFHEFSQLYECSSVPPFQLTYLWSPVQIHLQCSNARVRDYDLA